MTVLPALDAQFPAVSSAVADVRRALERVAAGRVADLQAVVLAATEAVNNVVVHAYREPGPAVGLVRVIVTVEADELLVAVTDEGVGMMPRSDSPGAGLGMPLMATLADRFEVQQRAGRTRVLLGFRRPERGAPPARPGAA